MLKSILRTPKFLGRLVARGKGQQYSLDVALSTLAGSPKCDRHMSGWLGNGMRLHLLPRQARL